MATERAAVAADPMNIDAAFNVADLDLVGTTWRTRTTVYCACSARYTRR